MNVDPVSKETAAKMIEAARDPVWIGNGSRFAG